MVYELTTTRFTHQQEHYKYNIVQVKTPISMLVVVVMLVLVHHLHLKSCMYMVMLEQISIMMIILLIVMMGHQLLLQITLGLIIYMMHKREDILLQMVEHLQHPHQQ